MARRLIVKLLALILFPAAYAFGGAQAIRIHGGSYPSFYKTSDAKITVPSFLLDAEPVTKAEFLEFLKRNPEWRKSKVKQIFSDSHYLQNWKSDLNFSPADKASPVTYVSWFAAEAYCNSKDRELPTTDQWEFAAYDDGRAKAQTTNTILKWYGQPNSDRLPAVGGSGANGYGVHDLFGLVWEWTLDFGDELPSDDKNLVCGAAGAAAVDPSDYATFMRYSFRSSLKANYSIANLGFRCAQRVH